VTAEACADGADCQTAPQSTHLIGSTLIGSTPTSEVDALLALREIPADGSAATVDVELDSVAHFEVAHIGWSGCLEDAPVLESNQHLVVRPPPDHLAGQRVGSLRGVRQAVEDNRSAQA
jgi:hypothetical protein